MSLNSLSFLKGYKVKKCPLVAPKFTPAVANEKTHEKNPTAFFNVGAPQLSNYAGMQLVNYAGMPRD